MKVMSDTEFLAPDNIAGLFTQRLPGVSQIAWGVRALRMDITDPIRTRNDPVSELSIKIACRSNLSRDCHGSPRRCPRLTP